MSDRAIQILIALASAVVSVLVGVVGTRSADYFFSKNQLIYNVIYSDPFVSNNQAIQIVRLAIKNDGNKMIEDVNIDIDTRDRTIDQYQTSGTGKDLITIAQPPSRFLAKIPYLNPEEQTIFQFLLKATGTIQNNLAVQVRAKGTTGKLEEVGVERSRLFFLVFPGVLSVSVFALMALYLTTKRRSLTNIWPMSSELIDEADSLTQRNYLTILYNRFNFPDFASRVLASRNKDITYLLESEAITNYVLQTNPEKLEDGIKLHEELLRIENMSPVSKDVIALNAAKLFNKKGDTEGAKARLARLSNSNRKLVRAKLELEDELKRLIA